MLCDRTVQTTLVLHTLKMKNSAIATPIVQTHESQLGKGSTFIMKLFLKVTPKINSSYSA
ncbi:hypothetical protein [Trichormus variabilis]|jgi:hypothetical protein|uniref:Uncharacterized protein n=1 Tax=Trichormus variabilis SAG 1403-4b TaxID=447716 RepID=A0A3S1IAV6_ANAVA|nr:hypothetical protein [Trichormus variabilis]MBD2628905.1 hypothetical protein [Trichormus variabilis FACHB-164]RUS94606.1 hypothetical protein DSM107003_37350 [Trichormus variabilis SAG 1403-4b]